MKQRPILFSTPMVEAILNQTKTQTRRIVKGIEIFNNKTQTNSSIKRDIKNKNITCPYGRVGDVLWVRETWQKRNENAIKEGFEKYYYKASFNGCSDAGWKPSIYMPKDAARIFLQITDIRIERLQEITNEDAKAEGIIKLLVDNELPIPRIEYKNYLNPYKHHSLPETWNTPYHSFQSLWESINGSDSWELNPFVWVVEFKQIAKPNE